MGQATVKLRNSQPRRVPSEHAASSIHKTNLYSDRPGASLMRPATLSSLLRVGSPNPLLSQSATAVKNPRKARQSQIGALRSVVVERTKRTKTVSPAANARVWMKTEERLSVLLAKSLSRILMKKETSMRASLATMANARKIREVRMVGIARKPKHVRERVARMAATMTKMTTRRKKAKEAKEAEVRRKAPANGLRSSSQKDGDPLILALKKKVNAQQQEQESARTASLTQVCHVSDRSATWTALERRPQSSVTSQPLKRSGRRRSLSQCAGATSSAQDVKLRKKTMTKLMTLKVSDSS